MNEQMVSAIATRDFETVHILVRRGAPIEIEAPGGLTAVIVATIEGHKHVLAQLAEIGADIDNFNSYGLSALSWALKRGDLVMVHHLLDIGAAIAKMPAQGGDPPLAVAARHGQIETIDVLLEHAEKLGPLEQQRLVNQQNNLNGGTALMIAARQRDMRTVRYLMRAGALAEVHDDQQLTASDHAFNRELGGFIANNKNVGAAGMESFSEKAAGTAHAPRVRKAAGRDRERRRDAGHRRGGGRATARERRRHRRRRSRKHAAALHRVHQNRRRVAKPRDRRRHDRADRGRVRWKERRC